MITKKIIFACILLVNYCLYSGNSNYIDKIFVKNKGNNLEFVPKNNLTGFNDIPFGKTVKYSALFFSTGDILNEDFETSSGWTYTNAATGNKWVIGSAVNNGGTKSLYISNNAGGNYKYDNIADAVVHAYKDITIPATTEEISISFDWKCLGKGTKSKSDYFNAWLVSDTFVPTVGTKITASTGERILLGEFNNNGDNFKNELFNLDSNSFNGNKIKIVFEWINDTVVGWQPPAAIDNLKISTVKCTKPSNVSFEDIKADSVTMKWDASKSSPAQYDVYYSKDSLPPTPLTVPTKSGITTTKVILDGLETSTVYYVWIRSVCGTEKGFWSETYKFKTICGIFKIPYTEGFNKNSNAIDCWTIINENGDKNTWEAYPHGTYEGDQVIHFGNYEINTDNDEWLISPTFQMDGTYRLKYHYKAGSWGEVNEFEVLLSEEGKEITDFKQTLVSKKKYTNSNYLEKIVIIHNVKGNINIAWHANGKGKSDIFIDNVIIEEVEDCAEPVELDVKEVESNQVTIFWQDLVGKKWEYFVQEDGGGAPSGSGIQTNSKEVVVTKDNKGDNLESNTFYEYYVRLDCEDGKFSVWSGPFKFKTVCEIYSIPFWEGFNSDSKAIDCWTIKGENNDNVIWKVYSNGAFEGDQVMRFNKLDFTNTTQNDDWLISPTIKMNGSYRLKYHYKIASFSGTNDFEVLLSKDGKEITDFKQTLVAKKKYQNFEYIEKTVILNKIVGDINIAWHANGKGSSTILIDNIFIENIKTCPEPVELNVKDILPNKVTIEWIDDSDGNSWEYFVQAPGKGEPTVKGNITSKKENEITREDQTGALLLPNTEYEFYVRTECGDGTNSLWSGPFVFRTECETFDLPFFEGFNTTSETIKCWTIIDENSDNSIWEPYSWDIFEGDQAMRFNKSTSDSEFVHNDWLISPTFKMNGTYRLKYHYRASMYEGTNDFEVLLSKDGKEITDFKQTLVPKKIYENEEYIEKIVILNNVVGDINIAWHVNGNENSTVYIDNVIIEEVVNCAEPVDLDVKDNLTDKATILWVDDSNSKSWEYFVQISGRGVPTTKGVLTSTKTNEVTIENETGEKLLPNTEYEFYVRTVCNDDGKYSIWSGPFVFRTGCMVFDLPFWEGFNSDTETFYCWTIIDENNDKITWERNPSSPHEGNRAMYFNNDDFDDELVTGDWLISPTFKTDGGTYRIKYHYKAKSFNNNEFEVLLSTKGKDVKDFTKTLLPKQAYKNKDYEEKVIFVDNLNGEVNIAWHIPNSGSSKVYLDNIFIEKVKGCPEPYYVKVTEQTESSVSIEWEEYVSGDKWEVIAIPYGENIPDEKDLNPIVVTNKDKATISGLESGKIYTFYVRAICKDGTPSDWSTGKDGATKVKINIDCSKAINIPVNGGADCNLFASGTLLGSTLSTTNKKPCNDDDEIKAEVWFEFTATSNNHFININEKINKSSVSASFLAAIYAEDCVALDKPFICFKASSYEKLTDLKVGKKYYLRIYSDSDLADYNFKICITTPGIYVSPSGGDYTVEELVKDVFVESECELVSDIKYQAGNNSTINTFGYFDRKGTDFPYEKGIVLTTHAVSEVPGPYTGKNSIKLPSWAGDPDLNEVINQIGGAGFGSEKYVSVLEFDFIPLKDSINFEYIFASESYDKECSVVCHDGGALFAAWLTEASGAGQNLALVPGTTEPIALSTIRDTKKSGANCISRNPKFFGQYYDDDPELIIKAPINYKGSTVPMTSEKVAVKVGEKYHIKIAIADFCKNTSHVSGVFFKAASFKLGRLDLGDDMLVATNTALCEGGEKTLDSGLDKDKATIQWYNGEDSIPGANDSKLTVSESGKYKVVGRYENIKCDLEGNILIERYPNIKITVPEDLNYCINSLTGKDLMDITVNEQKILKGLKAEEYEFFYYLTKEDSEKDKNQIENPKQFEIPKDEKSKEIYVRIVYKVSGCEVIEKFNLIPQRATKPESIADQQVCAKYIFKELPKGQHYFTKEKAQGIEYKAGDIIDKPGVYKIFICSISGDCYDESSFNIEVTETVEAKVFKDEVMECVSYVLQNLPKGNHYFTESDAQGIELFAGDTIRFTQTIYVYAKSEIGPDYCTDQSSFEIKFLECPISKGISPNGDGINDVLDLEVHGVTRIVIYNRYGTEVYSHGVGYTNQWHGQSNTGKELPDGTYYYVIEARGKTKTGWIQVNR